jgi:hypothetical protein
MLANSWDTMTKVMPKWRANPDTRRSIPAEVMGSKPGRGFVQEQNARIHDHGAGDGGPLLHAAA